MADNIFEWLGDNVVDPVKNKAVEIATDIKLNQIKDDYVDSFKDAFVTHDKLTPELIKQGWREGLDGQPYNTNLIYTADDWARDQANASADARSGAVGTGGTTGGGTATSGGVLVPQDLRQRVASGTMYEPDLSAYEESSLFDYAGPGGLDEYTYGQGLRTDGADYGIWGTPADVPNPYYWGQFGEGFEESTGVADGAISLPPVDMPAGVSPTNNNPNVGTNNTNINVGGDNTGGGHNYWSEDNQRVYEMMQQRNATGTNDNVVQEGLLENIKNWGSDAVSGLLANDDSAIQAAIDSGWSGTSDITDFTDAMDGDINAYKKILAADNQIKTTGHSRDGIINTTPINTALANSGLQWVDTGNNYDTGNRYDNAEDKAIAESILGGEAYAQMVYNNDPVAEAIPGLLGNSNDFNLGRPTDSNYVPFEPTYTEPVIGPFAGPPNAPAVEPQFGGGVVKAWLANDPNPDKTSYATSLLSTGETVNVNPITNTYTGTGLFKDGPPGRW